MRFTYSPGADALYVELAAVERRATRQQEIVPGVIMDFDAQDRVLGLELLGASRHVPRDQLNQAEPPGTWLTLKEAATEAAAKGEPISPDTLRSQAAKGKLKTEKRGRDLVVARHELWNYLENRAPAGRRAAGSASDLARRGAKKGGLQANGSFILDCSPPPMPYGPGVEENEMEEPRIRAKRSGRRPGKTRRTRAIPKHRPTRG